MYVKILHIVSFVYLVGILLMVLALTVHKIFLNAFNVVQMVVFVFYVQMVILYLQQITAVYLALLQLAIVNIVHLFLFVKPARLCIM